MKNITLRNLLGGFLGGVLGILMFRLFNWPGIFVGCLVGVTVGWFHQEIWAKFRSFCSAAPDILVFDYISLPKKPLREMLGVAAYKRFAASPKIGHALFYGLSLVTVVVILSFLWVSGAFFLYYYDVPRGTAVGSLTRVSILVGIFSSVVGFAFACLIHQPFRWSKLGQKLYQENSPILFWGKITLLVTFLSGTCTAVALVAATFFLITVLAIVLYVIPWAIKMLFQKTGHWLCLGVTLAVTSLVAWLGHPYLSNSFGLYLASLTAGVLSGGFAAVTGYCLERLNVSRDPGKVYEGFWGKLANKHFWVTAICSYLDRLGNAFGRRLGVPEFIPH